MLAEHVFGHPHICTVMGASLEPVTKDPLVVCHAVLYCCSRQLVCQDPPKEPDYLSKIMDTKLVSMPATDTNLLVSPSKLVSDLTHETCLHPNQDPLLLLVSAYESPDLAVMPGLQYTYFISSPQRELIVITCVCNSKFGRTSIRAAERMQ